MNSLKKVFALGVILTTVLSLTVVAGPVKAAAQPGDLIKMDGLSSVYYLGADGKRYVFPNEQTYFSWYSDFSGVVTVPQSELESYPLGKNVTVRPGTKLIKITTDPKVYAVEPNGNLVWVPSEAVAKTLFGDNWAKRVVDIADAFFTNYTVTTDQLTATAYPAGSLVKFGTSPDVYYINADGTASKIADEAAFNANRFNWNNIITATIAMPAAGTPITGAVASLTDTSSGAGGTAGSGTGLSVALSSNTAASASVPQNGSRIPMATVNLTASNDGAVTINSITVKRIGLSTYSDLDKVWGEKAGIVVASKKSVNSNDEAILTFSPALVVGAGSTYSLELFASFKTSSTGSIGLGIQSASAIMTGGATVSGSFPINGNLMSPIDYKVTNLFLDNGETSTLNVKVGDEKVELGKFTLDFNTYNSAPVRDIAIKSIMLKNNGVEDLAKTSMNLYLEYNGNKVSDASVVNGRYVTFTFGANGLDFLKDDSSKTFYLKGDVIAKESTDTNSYQFVLSKSTDLVAAEKTTGFGCNVYTTSTGNTAADNFAVTVSSTPSVTISAGAISVSKKAASPADTTIVKGSDNVVLLANIRADEAVTADGLNVIYGATSTGAGTVDQFENARVYLNGLLLDSFDPVANVASVQTKPIDSTLTLNKGDNEVKIMVKAKSNAAANAAFWARINGTVLNSQNAQYVSSGNTVNTGTDVSGTATGGTFTVQGASLTTTRNDGYAYNKVIVQGANDVSIGKFVLKATNDDITVTSIALSAVATTSSPTAASSIFDAKLFVNGTQVGNTVDFGSSGATFSSLRNADGTAIVIKKDGTLNVEVKASFDSAATGNFITTMTVNAQDSRGTAIGSGNTAITTNFSLTSSGTLTVEVGGNTPQPAILAAKAAEQEVAQYKFTAVNDSASLTEINIANTPTAFATSSAADSLISAVELYDGATLVDTESMIGGLAKFIISNDKVVVPANGTKTLSVRVTMNPISNDATATNKDIAISLVDVKFKSSAGAVTGPQAENDLASAFRVRATIPTVALQALPDTLLTAGDKVVSKFTVAADASGDVTLGKVVISYSTTSQASIAGIANNAVKINGSTKDIATVLDAGAKTLTVTFATPEVISAGTSKTFEFLATVGVIGTGSDSITTKIVEDANYSTGATVGAVSGNFIWSDGASITSYTYANGKRVPGLTTSTQTLSKS